MQEKLERPVLLNEYAFWQNSQEHPTLELVLMQFIPDIESGLYHSLRIHLCFYCQLSGDIDRGTAAN